MMFNGLMHQGGHDDGISSTEVHATALILCACDGPVPVGDLIAGGLELGYGTYLVFTDPTVTDAIQATGAVLMASGKKAFNSLLGSLFS